MRRVAVFILALALWLAASFPINAQAITHVVQPGENLFRIALRYGVTVDALAAANGLSDAGHIYVGQRLVIPDSTSGATTPEPAPTHGVHVVQPGENLFRIARRYGTSVAVLAALNGITNPNHVYVGQRLTLPDATSTAPVTGEESIYIVRAGDTLSAIALRYGVSTWALAQANHLRNPSLLFVGQRLHIPVSGSSSSGSSPPPVAPPTAGKWIDVDLTNQRVTAYVGSTPVRTTLASTGLPGTPTVTGQYRIYAKYVSTLMSGPGYYLPNVPYTMYFYRGYGLHGTYWHSNFGHPMSHGCVNLPTPEAEWLYNWAPVGTLVNIHY